MVHDVAAKVMAGGLAGAIAYVAGPPVMVNAALRVLIKGGMSARDIRYDKYS
jgi:toluene monooxygenase electron transfer component